MNTLKKYWPTILHVLALAAIFLTPSVTAWIAAHPAQAAAVAPLWAEFTHWLQSPNNNSGSKF